MKKFFILLFLIIAFAENTFAQVYTKQPREILKSFDLFWRYWVEEVKLSQNFLALDEQGKEVIKDSFLTRLITGDYLPLLLKTKTGKKFQLYKLGKNVDYSIRSTIAAESEVFYKYYRMEGTLLPGFSFTDLNGVVYNPENCKGKIVVLKCWFINCVQCVLEMPELNKLKGNYQKRNDIVFISLATDKAADLKNFLSKRKFTYAVVPEIEEYIANNLKITGFPTHLVVGKNGLISKVLNDVEDLKIALQEEVDKQ